MKYGRNDKCWCGSGKKYKRCHLDRENQEPVSIQEINKAFVNDKRMCLHPDASNNNCKSNIIKAHSVPKRGTLDKIAQDGHVYTYVRNMKAFTDGSLPIVIGRKGVNNASTFTGFCSYHDDNTFAPIEKKPFSGSDEQIFLLAYRSLCRELYAKVCQQDRVALDRKLDKGHTFADQVVMQAYIGDYSTGIDLGLRDLFELKKRHDGILQSNNYNDLGYILMETERPPDIVGSGGIYPEFDFDGNRLVKLELKDEIIDAYISFSSIATENGGAIIFSWLDDREHYSERFAKSLMGMPEDGLPHACVRFCFEFLENIFFAPNWWASLSDRNKQKLQLRGTVGTPINPIRRPNCLFDDGLRLVDWKITNIKTTL